MFFLEQEKTQINFSKKKKKKKKEKKKTPNHPPHMTLGKSVVACVVRVEVWRFVAPCSKRI